MRSAPSLAARSVPGRRSSVACGVCALVLLAIAAPVSAGGFVEETISFATRDGLELEGIVSYPKKGAGPFPAMLLVHGSGLHDADVTLDIPPITRGRQKLFRDVARYFSRRGLTVLRYNKRGASFEHESDEPEILRESTFDDLVDDAAEALAALRAHPKADPARLMVYGHSEGSLVAPRLARAHDDVVLVVMVGSVANRLTDILEYQLVDRNVVFLRLAGDENGDDVLTLEELDRLDGQGGLGSIYVLNSATVLYRLAQNPDGSLSVLGFNPDTDVDGDGALGIENEVIPALKKQLEVYLAGVRAGQQGNYQRSTLGLSNLPGIQKVKAHILFAQGELDVQTPLSETLALVEKLERKRRENFDTLFFPKLGHSLSPPRDFFKGDGGLTVLDNPTLDSMKKSVRKKILKRVKAALADLP